MFLPQKMCNYLSFYENNDKIKKYIKVSLYILF